MITGNLEYLMSSLPNLPFQNSEAVNPMVSLVFKKYAASPEVSLDMMSVLDDEAEKFLTSHQLELFKTIQMETIHSEQFQNNKNPVLSVFSIYMFYLKQELRAFRLAKKTNENLANLNYEFLTNLSDNPLEAEEQLIKLQWDKLESLCVGHYTDFTALIIYRLQLQLLLRWWSFDTIKGFEIFTKTYKHN